MQHATIAKAKEVKACQLLCQIVELKSCFFSQLKSRFQAAQNQIQELRQRLEQMELLVCFVFIE